MNRVFDFLFIVVSGIVINFMKIQMKKTFKYFGFSFLLMMVSGTLPVHAQILKQVSISGTLKNNIFNTASLYHVGKELLLKTSAPIGTDGKFLIKTDVEKTDFYKLQFDNNNAVWMILQPGEKVVFTSDTRDLVKYLEVTGSEQTYHVFKNQKMITANKNKIDSINMSYKEMATTNYDSLRKALTAETDKIKTNQDNVLKSFILKNPKSLAIMFLLEVLPVEANYDIYSKVDSTLFATHPDNFYVSNFHNQVNSNKATAIGVVAPDFTLPDTSGVNVSLSSFKGKFVLIDFWAAWCGPCRREMPNLVKLYSDFKMKNFEILGVSLDKTRENWVGAIRTEHMTWPQVSDLKFWQSEVAAMYSVKAIPYTVLVDKEGKIIAKNLRGEELYKKIESLLP